MIQITPAIDIIGGKCVRLTKGNYSTQKVYGEDPAELARRFANAGCTRLHVVDLDGAKANHIINYASLERICSVSGIVVDFGGGIKSDEDIRIALESGAKMITGGSIAVKNPILFEKWLNKYGAETIILGADARDGVIASNGWIENSKIEIIPFIADYAKKGIKKVISTDISFDGTLEGPSLTLYRNIMACIPDIYLIASGGVGTMADIEALNEIGVPEVIVGKAIYEGRITLDQLEKFNLL